MKTLFIGQNSIHLVSVNSTNSYASELLRQSKPSEGSLIYTFEQENGRGQRGNSWESEPNKNAALSVILYPTFLTPDKQFLLTKFTSLAVADLMAELLEMPYNIGIKWPNDIYAGDKKIAGILIENNIRENGLQSTIIGIGININQLKFNTTGNATSLALLANKEFDSLECIERLCKFLEARYLQLKTNKLESINNEYLQQLYHLHEWKNYIASGEKFQGKIIGVSTLGKLQVQLRSDEIKEFDLKEIEFCTNQT
ncbi:MAG: biotin--[acetyl-CoA-carboxylase] ligase [Bacteroidetes bacterium]|nr:biotin--[acetyl-CoA-carboxylase] ligase [Bacteroidota bacterium]